MSSPHMDLADAGCNGPFRVQLRLTLPVNYEEQWVPPPGGGIPIARVSEIQVALDQALAAMAADVLVTVTTRSEQHGTLVRTGLVLTSALLTFRGTADHEGSEPEPLPDDVQVWTAEVWSYASEPPTADVLDYAYIAGMWAAHLDSLTTGSGVDVQVEVDGVWLAAVLPAQQLDPEYPASVDREIEFPAT